MTMTTPPALPRLGLCCLALTAGLSLPAAAQTPPPGSEATTTPAPVASEAGASF